MTIILTALLLGCFGCTTSETIPATSVQKMYKPESKQNTEDSNVILASHGFRYVTVSEEQQQTLDAAIDKLTLAKQAKAQTRRIDHAATHLSRSINYAVIMTPRACTEYKGYFWFSRLDSAGKDDESFRSGFAVEKGTGNIYRWKE
jgi:hypothetical protein